MFYSLIILQRLSHASVLSVIFSNAVVVGDYDYVEGFSARKIRIRVYTPPGKKEQGRFALDYTIKSFDFYEDYFKVLTENRWMQRYIKFRDL